MAPDEYPSITKMFGIELEFFLLDHEGKISNEADLVLNELKGRLNEINITNECGHNMIELVTFPHTSSREVFSTFFKDFEHILYEMEVNDLKAFPYGTYPGKNSGKMREDTRYEGKAQILGQKNFQAANKCIGFHFHYSLPRNSFNKNILFFYPDLNQLKQDKVVNLFNLYIALDPAIGTLMQSSPYYEGSLLGKDARAIAYRGDSSFDFQDTLYGKHPDFGILNEYESDFKSMIDRLKERADRWKELLKDNEMTYSTFAKKNSNPSLLDSSWKPIKISPHGTIESRGADMNSMNKIIAMSSLMHTISRYVQNNNIRVVPDETGNKEPFKLEGDKLYVPEFEYLSKVLQNKSALEGLDDRDVHKYAKSMVELVKNITRVEARAPLRVFSMVLEDRRTTSDDIINFVKKKQGYTDYREIQEDTARELALDAAEKVYKHTILSKKMCETNMMFN